MKEKRFNHYVVFTVFLLICLKSPLVIGQVDSVRLTDLIKHTNEVFLYPLAHGVLLSPYELKEHNREHFIKNIEMVDAINFQTEKDTIPIIIENNKTIIHNPEERFNAKTYMYHKDGRINKVLRGRSLNDLYVYDRNGYLIQHGKGGELKKAKRNEKTFEWFNVNKNRLKYVTSYDEEDRLVSLKTSGYNFGPGVDYELELYKWNEKQLQSKTSLMKYKGGNPDTSFFILKYDRLGLVQSRETRSNRSTYWSTVDFDSSIDQPTSLTIRISYIYKGEILFSMTYDQYDNWIEMLKYGRKITREIIYRNKKRRR